MSHSRSLSKSMAALAVASALVPLVSFLPGGLAAGQEVMIRQKRVFVDGAAPAASAPVATTVSAPSPTTGPMLMLVDGGFASGEMLDAPGIRWQSPLFDEPFNFATRAVNAIHWPAPKDPVKPKGDYCFELAGGDVLYGSLIALNNQDATLEVPLLGKLRVERSALRRIDRWSDSADLIYSGPIGLTGWKEEASKKGWREEAGQPVSNEDGATLRGEVNLPPRAIVEFEFSWKNTPDFVFALGVGADDKADAKAFRFEVWDGQLVADRETETQADVAPVQPIATGPGRAHVQAYLDQESGRMTVVSSSGKPLGDLKVVDLKGKPLTNVVLTNNHGDVRLERLRIRKWNGESPREAKLDQSRIHLADGSIVYGQVEKFDTDSREFIVKGEKGETRVAAAKVASLFLSPPSDTPARTVRIVGRDGSRLSGNLAKVEGGNLWLEVPGWKEAAHIPVKELLSLVVTKQDSKDDVNEGPDGPIGTLEMEGLRLKGRLTEAKEKPGASCLAWRPEGTSSSSTLKPGVSGKIVYKEPKFVPPTARAMVRVRPAAPAGFVQGVFGGLADAQAQNGPTSGRRALHLRTGDVIPSEVTKIDEAGVTFKTTLSDSTFVAHEKIKAVELAPEPSAIVRINKAKKEKLLTLPRMQKDSPPTQMIRSKTGDFLRGRVLEMNDKTLKVEVRLEIKEIPRERVSRIIWLHPDEIEDPKAKAKKAAEAPKSTATRIQAIRSDGIRLTFTPEAFADSTLSGKSEVLGACRVKLDEVDGFLLGDAIEKAAGSLTYGPWKLHNAVEPIVAQDDGDGENGRTPGMESAMVGKPAPDFTLDLLGQGKKTFHLADMKGKVVILDFWATWCGPCLQAMPQVEAVAEEFKDKGVHLVAVNLEEDAKTISSMMERHKLKMTVALDRDGTTALKYQANAIPQTVIIDKEGNVARLFVGGGPKLGEQLKAAVEAVISGKAAEKPPQANGDPKVVKD